MKLATVNFGKKTGCADIIIENELYNDHYMIPRFFVIGENINCSVHIMQPYIMLERSHNIPIPKRSYKKLARFLNSEYQYNRSDCINTNWEIIKSVWDAYAQYPIDVEPIDYENSIEIVDLDKLDNESLHLLNHGVSLDDPYEIGEVVFEFEDAQNENFGIGNVGLKTYGKFRVYINLRREKLALPHFHIQGAGSGNKNFDMCVCIYSPHYYEHDIYRGTLSSKNRKKLDEFLRELSNLNPSMTNWQMIEQLWRNSYGTNNTYPEADVVQPDYKLMNSYKRSPKQI